MFVSNLRRDYAEVEPEKVIKFIKLLEVERHSTSLGNTGLQEYNKRLSGGSGKKRSLQFRFHTLMKRFLASNPTTRLLDDKRVLTGEQRLAVYWRDKGQCRVCKSPVADKDFEVHHVEAWYMGGPTTVDNSLTVCKLCHQKITAGQLKG
ncbi:MAG: HNH endonuclease [Chloroflexi bacterium]|nr:HNH endonuclease [Chloroflexota bacterium]